MPLKPSSMLLRHSSKPPRLTNVSSKEGWPLFNFRSLQLSVKCRKLLTLNWPLRRLLLPKKQERSQPRLACKQNWT